MKGFYKVFSFTFLEKVKSKTYLFVTLIGFLLLFMIPYFVITLTESDAIKETGLETENMSFEDSFDDSYQSDTLERLDNLYLVNEIGDVLGDFSKMKNLGIPELDHVTIIDCASYEEAKTLASAKDTSMIGVFSEKEDGIYVKVIAPSISVFDEEAASQISFILVDHIHEIIFASHGIAVDEDKLYPLVHINEVVNEDMDEDYEESEHSEDLSFTREILDMFGPYLNIMLVYFLVLYYGQGVAQCCIMEKSSKLMDTFLVSIKPKAMLLGKVLAQTASAILQFSVWILGLCMGVQTGLFKAQSMSDQIHSPIISLLKMVISGDTGFGLLGIISASLLIFAGFLLYCSMAAVGGSLASKQEELNTTNLLFTATLIVSFLLTLQSGFFNEMIHGFTWIDLFPFTAVMVTPARVLLGYLTVGQGIISLMITMVVSILILTLAGKLYVMMSFYKGNAPKPREIVKMVFSRS